MDVQTGGTLVRRVPRQNVGYQDRRSADNDVTHCDMSRRLSLLFSLPNGMQITRDGVSQLPFSSVAKAI